jgi:hypothetical protein
LKIKVEGLGFRGLGVSFRVKSTCCRETLVGVANVREELQVAGTQQSRGRFTEGLPQHEAPTLEIGALLAQGGVLPKQLGVLRSKSFDDPALLAVRNSQGGSAPLRLPEGVQERNLGSGANLEGVQLVNFAEPRTPHAPSKRQPHASRKIVVKNSTGEPDRGPRGES